MTDRTFFQDGDSHLAKLATRQTRKEAIDCIKKCQSFIVIGLKNDRVGSVITHTERFQHTQLIAGIAKATTLIETDVKILDLALDKTEEKPKLASLREEGLKEKTKDE